MIGFLGNMETRERQISGGGDSMFGDLKVLIQALLGKIVKQESDIQET